MVNSELADEGLLVQVSRLSYVFINFAGEGTFFYCIYCFSSFLI